MGPLHQEFERLMGERVGSGNFTLWNNGTTALIAALSALELSGEVIVTPFTFPATIQALTLIGLTPRYADIDGESWTIDPKSVEDNLNDRVTGILGTHIYGAFCDYDSLWALSRAKDLRLVFDGAHTTGKNAPLLPNESGSLGDVTMLSFHATKLTHSVEGGGLITGDDEIHEKLLRFRNFGFLGEDSIRGQGLNGKMSELHAAVGLEVLKLVEKEILRRRKIAARYSKNLTDVPGLKIQSGLGDSVQYFVLRIDEARFGHSRDVVWSRLRERGYLARRYFYPLCSDIEGLPGFSKDLNVPRAREAVSECLVLPFFGDLRSAQVDEISEIINGLSSSARGI
jgi:dTDP-4-amino-4,6-dideoxygalactose transaminase